MSLFLGGFAPRPPFGDEARSKQTRNGRPCFKSRPVHLSSRQRISCAAGGLSVVMTTIAFNSRPSREVSAAYAAAPDAQSAQ
jgi:hypothetical protein